MGHRLGFIALLAMGCTLAAADPFDAPRAFIRKELLRTGTQSAAVGVALGGRIVWEEGFGLANREDRIPATADTVYPLGSLSMPITATGLMTLVQKGKLALDQPIDGYLGDVKLAVRVGEARDVTVRRIANHTSGLSYHYHYYYGDESRRLIPMDETILRYGNVVNVPGERFELSRLGYGLLGYAMGRASGLRYEDYMRESVFIPLGMTHTSACPLPELERFRAVGYDSDGYPVPMCRSDHPGASAIYSSAHDLVRFGMFHLKDHLSDQAPILADSSLDEMHRPSADAGQGVWEWPFQGYGIGWNVESRSDGRRMLSHEGDLAGSSVLLRIIPSEDIAVVVLTNASYSLNGPPVRIADRILSALLPGWTVTADRPAVVEKPFSPKAELLGKWSGTVHTYRSDLSLTLEFLASGDVHMRLGDQVPSLLVDVTYENGRFTGLATGELGVDDVNRHPPPHYLEPILQLRGKQLKGVLFAAEDGDQHNGLPYWAELTKVP